MTRAERRVAIATDVIKAINAKRFGKIAAGVGYVRKLKDPYFDGVPHTIDQEVASDLMPRCTVCARGAMMLCRISKYNGIEIVTDYSVDDRDTSKALKDAFSVDQLSEIEQAFESTPSEYSGVTHAECFGASFEDDEDRLIAIMQNIIDHNGTFRPKVQYEMK